MISNKTVLIISFEHNIPAEDLTGIRAMIMDQINEGVLVLPPWMTGTVANLDLYVPEPVFRLNEPEPKKTANNRKELEGEQK